MFNVLIALLFAAFAQRAYRAGERIWAFGAAGVAVWMIWPEWPERLKVAAVPITSNAELVSALGMLVAAILGLRIMFGGKMRRRYF